MHFRIGPAEMHDSLSHPLSLGCFFRVTSDLFQIMNGRGALFTVTADLSENRQIELQKAVDDFLRSNEQSVCFDVFMKAQNSIKSNKIVSDCLVMILTFSVL